MKFLEMYEEAFEKVGDFDYGIKEKSINNFFNCHKKLFDEVCKSDTLSVSKKRSENKRHITIMTNTFTDTEEYSPCAKRTKLNNDAGDYNDYEKFDTIEINHYGLCLDKIENKIYIIKIF